LTLEASARQTDCPRKTRGLEENLGAADVDMTGEPFERIEAELAKIEIHGNRTEVDIAKLRGLN